MEELMIVANVAIIFGVVYKLFELFVGKKERMMLIEKLSSEELMKGGTKRPALPLSTFTFSSLFIKACSYSALMPDKSPTCKKFS